MGRLINFDEKLSDEDKEYLQSRGRGNEIIENDRRFAEGAPEGVQKFDTEARAQADYDVGGAPLPGSILDTDTGRVIPRQEFTDGAPDEGDVDDDIVEEVESLNVAELKARLREEGVAVESGANKAELQDALAIHLHDKRHPQ
jgi:hypothetical protein